MNNDEDGDPDDIASRILRAIAALPLAEQEEAILVLIGGAIKHMSRADIFEIRDEITSQFPEDVQIVRTTIELIDGQLALRAIAGSNDWR